MPKVFQKPTISDVAQKASVSKSAVSHYINGRVGICSEETGRRIRHAITELSFVPARSILHQQARATQTIGICVARPPRYKDNLNYTHLHEFWNGLESVSDEHDYRLLHFPKSVRDGKSCDAFLNGSIDGILISARRTDQRFETLARAGLPTVATARWSGLPATVGSVWSDDDSAIDLAMGHLWNLGHRRIAYVASTEVLSQAEGGLQESESDVAIARYVRYRSWLSEQNADAWQLVIPSPSWDPLSLDQAQKALAMMRNRSDPPTAILCANDAFAYSILSAAKTMGIRIPRDLSVVGIDNNISCAQMDPPLTTVELPFWEIGRESLLLLHEMMRSRTVAERRITIPVTKLVIRESTAPPSS